MRRFAAIVGWLAAVAFGGVCCLTIGLWLRVRWAIFFDKISLEWLSLAVSLAIPMTVFAGVCFLINHVCRRHGLDHRGFARVGGLAALAVSVAWLVHDGPPVENDYTSDDLVSHDPRVLASRDAFRVFLRESPMSIGSATQFRDKLAAQTNPVAYRAEMEQAWADLAGMRAAMVELDAYPALTRVTSETRLSLDMPGLDYTRLRDIVCVLETRTRLCVSEGRFEEASRELATWHRICRKSLRYACLVDKLFWVSVTRSNTDAVQALVFHPDCPRHVLLSLRESFRPLTDEEISLRRSIVGEYLVLKTVLETPPTSMSYLDVLVDCPWRFAPRGVKEAIFRLTFRRNRTLRTWQELHDLAIEGASRQPPDCSAVDTAIQRKLTCPEIRNLSGWLLTVILIPSYQGAAEKAFHARLRSELLYLAIDRRLGEKVALTDPYTGAPYPVDEKTGLSFSVGADRRAHTKDDIRLHEPAAGR